MREAFGGTFMIKLMLVFIIIYVAFMAIAINYAKTFRVKNQIINILEQYQYDIDKNSATDTSAEGVIDRYLASVPYSVFDVGRADCEKFSKDSKFTYLSRGVCITMHGTTDASYYTVTTYMYIERIPFLGAFNLSLPVRGETKTIVR